MTVNHGDFEVRSALAASGLLTRAELSELSEHAAHCVLCHDRLVEFRQAGIQLFLVNRLQNSSERLPRGMQQRFVARAIREGIPLRAPSQGVRFSALGAVTVVMVALLLAAANLNNGSLPNSSPAPVALDKEIPSGTPGALVATGLVARCTDNLFRRPKEWNQSAGASPSANRRG